MLPLELDSLEEVAVAAVAVWVAAGAVVLGVAVPWEVVAEVLGAAAGAGAVEIFGAAGAGVVAAGVLGVAGVAGAVVVGVAAGGAKTAAPAVLGSASANIVSRHRADLDTDAWVNVIERIVLRGLPSIAPGASAGKRWVPRNRMGWHTP